MGLENCPTEIVGEITRYIDLIDAGHLRLTNRYLRSTVTQGFFRSYVRSRRVKLTGTDLQRLVVLTQRGWLGCGIRHLTLVGVVNNTKSLEAALKANEDDPRKRDLEVLRGRRQTYQQLLESGQIAQLLSQIFKNLAVNNTTGKLRSLSLAVTVYRQDAKREIVPLAGGSWRLIWQTAAETFRVVLAALQESKLEVDCLNVFSGPLLQKCSLESLELARINYNSEGLIKALGALKNLSVSISERIIDLNPLSAQLSDEPADEVDWPDDEPDKDINEVIAEAQDENNFVGLADLLRVCHGLKSLHIHQYLVDFHNLSSNTRSPIEKLFQRVAELDTLPALEECSLRGVFVRETDLLAFLKRVHLRRLSMENVVMVSGTYRSIFDFCTDEASRLSFLYVDELMIQNDLIYFTGAGEPRFRTWVGAHGSNTLKREGEQLKQPILYHPPDGPAMPVASPARQEWLLQQRREYGPPKKLY
ncbi:F-box domain protein [Aspergillus terreus]|uniref:F-box domain protein n=1 Tax=Aspergillus terreus TaxID=33178 RepID=A0A5M3YVF2_ASPTE|nr:hypothetical protein ATETN484_0004082100 [Aspergillus terreus]GFF13889.1 F-box domain protein [Aspergillus terreus]